MNKKETIQVLQLLKINYPQSFKDYGPEQTKAFAELWSSAFSRTPVELVIKAVQSIIYSDPREFAPNIGQVNYKIAEMISPNSDKQACECWDEIMQAITRYGCDDLTELHIQKINPGILEVMTLSEIKHLGRMNYGSLEFEKTNFMKSFKKDKQRHEAQMIATGRILELSDESTLNALGFKTNPETLMIETMKEGK